MQFKLVWKYKAFLKLKFRKLKPSQLEGPKVDDIVNTVGVNLINL
jgi:hypothetical protein